MSLNLALQRGRDCEWSQVIQTPSDISRKVIASENPTQVYKDYVKTIFDQPDDKEYLEEHFEFIDGMIQDGFKWIII